MKRGEVPRALARLQFHPGFTLDDAISVVPYLARLGVSHVYASPLLTARRGSTHGYDVVDHAKINPELGGRAALERLAEALERHGMGIVLDIVPNHMAADARENAWWRDVLARGRASAYAAFFDIDWSPPDPSLAGKVLLPILGQPYADALRAGEIHVARNPEGVPEIAYFAERLPIDAASKPALIAAAERDPAALERLLDAQHYRLAYWKAAGSAINWRRFFDVGGLVALNADRRDVFVATHALILELFSEGIIAGVRVDHVDGLADPARYCRRLRRALTKSGKKRGAVPYIAVEKILALGETLRSDWGVDGSTGYDFMNEAAALLHDPAGEAPLSALWEGLTGDSRDFATLARDARREILIGRFAADLGRVVRALGRAFEKEQRVVPPAALERDDLAYAQTSRPRSLSYRVIQTSGDAASDHHALERVVAELIAAFPVYRAYTSARGASDEDRCLFDRAVAGARPHLRRDDQKLLPILREALLAPSAHRAAARLAQVTATLAAKGVEDTAFYRYGRLLSRNEVGADPGTLAISPEVFHASQRARGAAFPSALVASATHDQKRGEDVRARLAVLSEIPNEWGEIVARWRRGNTIRRSLLEDGAAPSPADELMLYQTLIGAWPAMLEATDAAGVRRFGERVAAWQQKAIREEKLQSDWYAIDPNYEDACRKFLFALLEDSAFVAEIARFANRIGPAGAVNGLAQTVLRLTVPGVPDLYQGTEFWDESLVDPDDRRPVDFSCRAAALAAERPLAELIETWRSGRIKQALIARLLALRKRFPHLFATGSYRALATEGGEAQRSLFFARTDGDTALLVGITRLSVPLLGAETAPRIAPEAWRRAMLPLPEGLSGRWQNALETAEPLRAGRIVPLGSLFGSLPVTCWIDAQK